MVSLRAGPSCCRTPGDWRGSHIFRTHEFGRDVCFSDTAGGRIRAVRGEAVFASDRCRHMARRRCIQRGIGDAGGLHDRACLSVRDDLGYGTLPNTRIGPQEPDSHRGDSLRGRRKGLLACRYFRDERSVRDLGGHASRGRDGKRVPTPGERAGGWRGRSGSTPHLHGSRYAAKARPQIH
ncbi:MAG: hypothetical protein BWY06_03298 [Candidatus Latescibacteria bacterium ADurb.Bin168]|nr:MAG: hypothetical protein BWY06_03298 [Candidatus Latescibacteria bacterium ADurb.Bin168]